MAFLDDQRIALISGLESAGYPEDPRKLAHPELMFTYLGIVELRTEPTLLERLAGWAAANSIPITQAALRLGF